MEHNHEHQQHNATQNTALPAQVVPQKSQPKRDKTTQVLTKVAAEKAQQLCESLPSVERHHLTSPPCLVPWVLWLLPDKLSTTWALQMRHNRRGFDPIGSPLLAVMPPKKYPQNAPAGSAAARAVALWDNI